MTLCPIAIVAGCRKCPAFALCPLKTVLGDAPRAGAAEDEATPKAKPAATAGEEPAPKAKAAAKPGARPRRKSRA